MTSDEAVDVGLCHGRISGQRRALDDTWYLQKCVPRRPGSRWSQVNVRRVEALEAAGRMRPGGRAEVAAARADGRWAAAYVSQQDFAVPRDLPPELRSALDAEPEAAEAFRALPRREQYAAMLALVTTRTAAGRARRLERLLEDWRG